MKQLYEVDTAGHSSGTTTKRSAYILDGALGNELDVGARSFSMELLYLLLPIIGAFLLLFSVCCCGKTLKKMLHIPKVVVMGSYAAMQLENQNPRRRHSFTGSSSSSSDEEEEEEDDEEDEEEMRRREEDRRREVEMRRNMSELEERRRSEERARAEPEEIRELWDEDTSQRSLSRPPPQHICMCDRENKNRDVERWMMNQELGGRISSSYDSETADYKDSRQYSDNQVVSVVIHENHIFDSDIRQFESDSDSVVVCHTSGDQGECDKYPRCNSTGNSCQCKTVSRQGICETNPCIVNETNESNPATREDLNDKIILHNPDHQHHFDIPDPDFEVIVHDLNHSLMVHDLDHRMTVHDPDVIVEDHESVCDMQDQTNNNTTPRAMDVGGASRPNTLLELDPRLLDDVAARRSNRSLQPCRKGCKRNSIKDKCSRLKRLKNPLNQHNRGLHGTDNDMFKEICSDEVPVTSQSCPLLHK